MKNTTPKPHISRFNGITKLIPWIAFVLVFTSLMKLGFWQISRAEQKTVLLEKSAAKRNQSAVSIEQLQMLQDKQYVPIILKGKWLHNWSFYLDNRFQESVSGYNLFSLFEDQSGAKLFVDRGWQANSIDRKFNYIEPNYSQIQVLGYVYQPSVYKIVEVPELQPNRVEAIPGLDMPQFIATLAEQKISLESFVVRQTFPEVEDGLIRQWRIVGSPPERNIGYAVQWFLMALALLIIAVLNINKNRKSKASNSA